MEKEKVRLFEKAIAIVQKVAEVGRSNSKLSAQDYHEAFELLILLGHDELSISMCGTKKELHEGQTSSIHIVCPYCQHSFPLAQYEKRKLQNRETFYDTCKNIECGKVFRVDSKELDI